MKYMMSVHGNSINFNNTNITMKAANNDRRHDKPKSSKSNSITNISTASGICKDKRRDRKCYSVTNSSSTSGVCNAGSSPGHKNRSEYKLPISDHELDGILFHFDNLDVNMYEDDLPGDLKANVESSFDINPEGDNNIQKLKTDLERRMCTREIIMKCKKEKQDKFRKSLLKMEKCHMVLHNTCSSLKLELKAAKIKIKTLEASLTSFTDESYNTKQRPVKSIDPPTKIKHALSDTESMLTKIEAEDKKMMSRRNKVPCYSSNYSDTTELTKDGVEKGILEMCLNWRNSSNTGPELFDHLQSIRETPPPAATENGNYYGAGTHKQLVPLNLEYSSTEDQNIGIPNTNFKRSLSQVRAAEYPKKSFATQTSIPDLHSRHSKSSQREVGYPEPLFKPPPLPPKLASGAGPLFKQSSSAQKTATVDDGSLSSQHRFSVTSPQLKQSLASLKKTNCGDSQFQISSAPDHKVSGIPKLKSYRGIPVANPHYQHSLATGEGDKWVYHAPPKPVPMGTVMKPVVSNGKAVKKIPKYKDIIDSRTSKYCLISQEQDTDGELETMLYKGNVVPTCGGGAQIIFNDVEMLKQSSPEQAKKVSSDVAKKLHY